MFFKLCCLLILCPCPYHCPVLSIVLHCFQYYVVKPKTIFRNVNNKVFNYGICQVVKFDPEWIFQMFTELCFICFLYNILSWKLKQDSTFFVGFFFFGTNSTWLKCRKDHDLSRSSKSTMMFTVLTFNRTIFPI